MDWTPEAAPEVTVCSPAEVPDEDDGEQEVEECGDWEEVDGTCWGPGAAALVTTEVDRDTGGLEQGGERQG